MRNCSLYTHETVVPLLHLCLGMRVQLSVLSVSILGTLNVTPAICCDGEKVVLWGGGCVGVPCVGAAGECMGCSSGGRLDRHFLPLPLLCSTSP